MKGILFAILGGMFITLQGVANTRIGTDTGTWQAAALTQFTGFAAALLLMLILRDHSWKKLRQVRPLYLTGGSFAAIVIFSNVTAIQHIGVTLSIAAILIAQLAMTFLVDSNGMFEVPRQPINLPQLVGIGMMVAGVVVISL